MWLSKFEKALECSRRMIVKDVKQNPTRVYFLVEAGEKLLAWCRGEAASPLCVSHVLQGLAVASRQASGSKASLCVA